MVLYIFFYKPFLFQLVRIQSSNYSIDILEFSLVFNMYYMKFAVIL